MAVPLWTTHIKKGCDSEHHFCIIEYNLEEPRRFVQDINGRPSNGRRNGRHSLAQQQVA
jgi:hypothetical protein